MKKIVSALFLYLNVGLAQAAGPYDGIWTIDGLPEAGYLMTSENSGKLIFVGLNPPDFDGNRRWGASWGDIKDGTVRLTRLINDNIDAVTDVVFTSPTTLTLTQKSCRPINPNYVCSLPNGVPFAATKIW
ncbi:hypothetical protein [Nitrosomonas oligotropha]|uniref:hypothetical protein n=1 Tax=Nitrosomonas oligotropha TaxID=42354 RepID=UPI00136B8BC4|nr:hypothetical protein [Nitrosomonas oligotropha]MXS82915.1 hypothetical protein [Nitrosomonas oligotropha]